VLKIFFEDKRGGKYDRFWGYKDSFWAINLGPIYLFVGFSHILSKNDLKRLL